MGLFWGHSVCNRSWVNVHWPMTHVTDPSEIWPIRPLTHDPSTHYLLCGPCPPSCTMHDIFRRCSAPQRSRHILHWRFFVICVHHQQQILLRCSSHKTSAWQTCILSLKTGRLEQPTTVSKTHWFPVFPHRLSTIAEDGFLKLLLPCIFLIF